MRKISVMQTTLRIDDALYREAKAEAARSGLTLTRFIEEGLKLRLGKSLPQEATAPTFRVYRAIHPDQRSWEEVLKAAEEAQGDHDIAKLETKPKRL